MRDLVMFGLGVVLVVLRLWWVIGHEAIYENGMRVRVVGRISNEPETQGWNQVFDLGVFGVEAPRWPLYRQGQKIEVTGSVYVSDRNKYLIIDPKVILIDESRGLTGWIMDFRLGAVEAYQKVLPEPGASLLSGVVWGGRSGLSYEFVESLKKTGTMHVVAASGMNVTLVAGFLVGSLVTFLTRRLAVVVGLVVILCYVVAAGGMSQPSVVRAGIMAGGYLAAQFFGRQYRGIRILIGTGLVMLFVNPLWLFEIGWQLSMAATTGLMVFGHIGEVEKMGKRGIGRVWGLVEGDFRVSLAATLATLPIMVGNFGQLSLIAPFTNALVLWVIGPVMGIGFVIGIVHHIPFLGALVTQMLAWAAWVLLSYFVFVVEALGSLPMATLEGIKFPWWLEVGYYLVFLVFIFRRSKKL